MRKGYKAALLDNMALSTRFLAVFLALSVVVEGQLNIQSVLNQFCAANPNITGCKVPSVNIFRPEPLTPPPAGGGGGRESCSASSRRCSQLPDLCVPRNIDCGVIGSKQRCQIPVGLNFDSQTLMCGDGTPFGVRCGDGSAVPVLTQLLLQCKGANSDSTIPVRRIGALQAVGHEGGAGVYLCGSTGSWEPMFGSPAADRLVRSCSNSECGRVPQPAESQAVHRPWSWVRAIYHEGRVVCTGTIVSSSALLTAAHCLTRSQVSTLPRRAREFKLELPGPNDRVKRINVTAQTIHIHPRYRPQVGRLHDLALIIFRSRGTYNLPIACLADRPHMPTGAGLQVVFRLEEEFQSNEPVWRNTKASWDNTCRVVGTRSSASCKDELIVQPSQFCASHPDLLTIVGSSGSPYLAEVGAGLQEVWVVLGVLSQYSNASSCGQGHSIYSQVAENSNWIKSCIFDENCK